MNTLVDVPSRVKALKAATTAAHDRLDKRIMEAKPFQDRDRYGRFLIVQRAFHRDIDALYDNPALDELLPDLAGRRRLPLIERDLADLGIAAPHLDGDPRLGAATDLPTALGWLYVAEGSNLGAAFLLKEAEKLGLSETFGARHLAAAPEGRGLHWRTFTASLDTIALSDSDNERVVDSGRAAFERVFQLVETHMPLLPGAEQPADAVGS